MPTSAAEGDGYLFGLGLHQETGRDIYLGGIYLANGAARPEHLQRMPDPWTMEYRIVARRTSIRSLLGGILLQSEVATGRSPGPATTAFADNILSGVKSSLYAGDSLEVQLKDNVTYAALNGQRLARSSNPEVAAYFLSGWMSENGPNSAFRTDLIADKVNPQLLDQYNATQYSAQRKAEVAAWFGGPAPQNVSAAPAKPGIPEQASSVVQNQPPASEAQASAQPLPNDQPVSATVASTATSIETQSDSDAAVTAGVASVTDPAANKGSASENATATDAAVAGSSLTTSIVAKTATDSTRSDSTTNTNLAQPDNAKTTSETQQAPVNSATLAALIRDAELPDPAANSQQSETGASALGVQEYSQRLAVFHSQMIAKVYGKIRYPKRAVRRNIQGRLELDVSISSGGELLGVEIAQSSGHKILDDSAISAAQDAFKSKLDAMDEVALEEFGTGDGSLIVPIPVQFRLQ